ncbi:hypothetical protein AAB988_22740 [Burkholderia contaminans]
MTKRISDTELLHRAACYPMLVDALRELLSFIEKPTTNASEREITAARIALARADIGPLGVDEAER